MQCSSRHKQQVRRPVSQELYQSMERVRIFAFNPAVPVSLIFFSGEILVLLSLLNGTFRNSEQRFDNVSNINLEVDCQTSPAKKYGNGRAA